MTLAASTPIATVPLASGLLRLSLRPDGLAMESDGFTVTVPASALQALHEATGRAICEATWRAAHRK